MIVYLCIKYNITHITYKLESPILGFYDIFF